jgi:hypothetical protein
MNPSLDFLNKPADLIAELRPKPLGSDPGRPTGERSTECRAGAPRSAPAMHFLRDKIMRSVLPLRPVFHDRGFDAGLIVCGPAPCHCDLRDPRALA